MDKINYSRLNVQKYEQHLSEFGKKVLKVLIKNSVKARYQKKNQNEYKCRQFPSQHKKVLTFNDESVGDTSSTGPIPKFSTIPPNIPKSDELIKIITNGNESRNNNLTYKIENIDSFDDFAMDEVNFKTITNENGDLTKETNWDNMFDSDIFVDIATKESDNKETNANSFNIRFPGKNIVSGHQKRKIRSPIEPKIKKAKNMSGAIENPPNSKIITKNVVVDKPNKNIRKQKYTKTVKNWLDNVEIQQTIGEDVNNIENLSNIASNNEKTVPNEEHLCINNIEYDVNFNNKTNTTDGEKSIVKKSLKNPKRVVQAQLANKDGVMKYSKPKDDGEASKKVIDSHENKLKASKEKSAKKFNPPIKSQIPVKDVKYEVYTINADNIELYINKLREIKLNEVVAVLVFSNGFCQLNSHYTESTCEPDGIVVNNEDIFYYFKGACESFKEILKYVFENNKIICYGARSLLIYLASYFEMEINSISIYDAQIGASLLDPDNPSENFTALQKMLSFTATFKISTECTLQKTAWYMTLLIECWGKLHGMLVEDSLWKVFVEIEMKLLPIIAHMELRGISIDTTKLKYMEDILLNRMKVVEQQCYKAAGKMFQINSAMQVRAILYDELQLDTKSNVKIRETLSKGSKSTSESMLRSLITDHPLPKLILEYRSLHKAHATFLTGIAQYVKDGVVRPTWIQTASATGRIASSNPNLQAIPKAPYNLVMYPEGDDNEKEQLVFRSVYVCGAGRRLLAADFKHVECRVFAHAAADTALLQALAEADDLFKLLAAKWLKKSEKYVVEEERERTKRLVYASLYGAGTRKLMEILNVDYQKALEVAASFNRTFPSLKSFGRDVVSRCRAGGGRLASVCGRVRRFLHIDSNHFTLKSHAERQAVNFIVQGSAADLCKLAMILTEEHLRASTPPVEAHLVLQIHDELVWEVKDEDIDRAAVLIQQVMEGCGQVCGMAVPLPVAVSVGKDWGHMHAYTHTSSDITLRDV